MLRVVWAFAHPESSLGPADLAVHTCGQTGDAGTGGCCVEPSHLEKADWAQQRAVALYTQRRRKKKESAS